MKCSSDELNKRISDLDSGKTGYEAFGGKPIPYIGWLWRYVDFDDDSCALGVIPAGADGNDANLVGFMENNKWGYPYICVKGDDWRELVELIEKVVDDPSVENLSAVNDRMQSFASDRQYYEYEEDGYTYWF